MNHTTNENNMTDRAVISVHASPETSERLGRLAKMMKRSKSFLANEAIERYLAYEEWAVAEIRKGIDAADHGEVVADTEVEAWVRSLGTADELPLPQSKKA